MVLVILNHDVNRIQHKRIALRKSTMSASCPKEVGDKHTGRQRILRSQVYYVWVDEKEVVHLVRTGIPTLCV